MKRVANFINLTLYRHKIVLILISFIFGILLNELSENTWALAAILGIFAVIIAAFYRNLSFLLFIPLGLIFAANSTVISENNILKFADQKIDLEGVIYKAPEHRESGIRLFLDTQIVILEGAAEPASGKVIIHISEETRSLSYGDRIRVLDLTLRTIENFKNPGGFNLKKFYERQGIYARGFTEGEQSIISFGLDKSYSRILNYIDYLRLQFGNYVIKNFPSPESNILNALTVGEKGAIPQDVRTEFSKAGVAHVLAISGLHVGAVALVFFFIIKWLLKRSEYMLLKFRVPRLTAALTIIPIFLYTAVAGFSTSTVRAFIMISVYLMSIVLGKEEYKLNTLSAAALIILLWHPWSLFEISFQLSFAAVFGILLTHKFYPFKFHTLREKFYSLVKTTIAASIATSPIVADSFGILPLASIPANVILVPLVEFVIVPISLISFICYLVLPEITSYIISLNIFFIDMFMFGVESILKIPYSSLTIPPMSFLSWALIILLSISLLLNAHFKKIKYVIPIIITGLFLSLILPYPGKTSNGILETSILDVGENKSFVLLTFPDGANMAILGGYSKNDKNGYIEKTVISKFLLQQRINKLDTLVLSSTDKDTLSGAVHIIEKFDVEELFINGQRLSGELWEKINNRDTKWQNLLESSQLTYSKHITIDILKPGKNYLLEDSSVSKPIAFKLKFRDYSFVFGHSLNQESFQRELIDLNANKISSVALYISKVIWQETCIELLSRISPKILITGNSDLLTAKTSGETGFKKDKITVLETDMDGTVTIKTDGRNIELISYSGGKDLFLH